MICSLVQQSSLGALVSRGFQTTSAVQDVDSAAKFIGAGAATVGVAGMYSLVLAPRYALIIITYLNTGDGFSSISSYIDTLKQPLGSRSGNGFCRGKKTEDKPLNQGQSLTNIPTCDTETCM